MQGSRLAERLIERGDEVTILDNFRRGHNKPLGAEIVSGDLRYSFFAKYYHNVDAVFHLAANVGGIEYITRNDQQVMLDNLQVDANVIRAAQEGYASNFVYASTACVYPVRYQQLWDSKLSEDMAFDGVDPESGYGWAKLTGEVQLGKVKDMRVGILRLFNVYGPGEDYEPGSHVVPELIRKTLAGGSILDVYGDGKAGRCFTYSEDAVDAYLAVLEKGMDKGPINIGSPDPIRIGELAKLILRLSGEKKRIRYLRDKPVGVIGRVPVVQRAEEILGWKATMPLERGLKLTIDWMRAENEKQSEG